MDTKEAVNFLTKKLKRDKDFYRTYQCNIALQFFDEVNRRKIKIEPDKLMEISQNAAKNFLDLWIE